MENSNGVPPRRSLADTVAIDITDQIAEGKLRTGDPVPTVAMLAEQYAVSRPVIREALLQLAGRGLLDVRQGRTTRVCEPTAEPLQELLDVTMLSSSNGFRDAIELRRALEPEIAAGAALRASAEDLQEVEAAYADMVNASGTQKAWVAADLRFHIALAKASKNTLLFHLVQAIRGVIEETMRLRRGQSNNRDPEETLKRHRNILDRIIARDIDGARAAAETHSAVSPEVMGRISDLRVRGRKKLGKIPR